MNDTIPTENTFNRLAKALMEKHGVSYGEALYMLETFELNLICGEEIRFSPSLQAALLTAVNTGKRAFHGGVRVKMPPRVLSLLPWPKLQSLNEIAVSLGARMEAPSESEQAETLYFGLKGEEGGGGFQVLTSGWKGGIAPSGVSVQALKRPDFATGGILAGAFAVGRAFLRLSGISTRETVSVEGFSLWRPDLDWLDEDADGPEIELLPQNLWFLGLGHLGQAYLWNLCLLPFEHPEEVHFLLQDFDTAVEANFGAQLLCEKENIGVKKTRFCAAFLEARRFKTTISERPFDDNTKRSGDEPFTAFCGFDAADPRRLLESAGFDLIIECALGGSVQWFDRVLLHTFPGAARKPEEIWRTNEKPKIVEAIRRSFESEEDCGILAATLAGKAISTSFVGAFAGAMAVGEVIRALHGGQRFEFAHAQLRLSEPFRTISNPANYLNMIARSGFTYAAVERRLAA
jgi:hypothetical protein